MVYIPLVTPIYEDEWFLFIHDIDDTELALLKRAEDPTGRCVDGCQIISETSSALEITEYTEPNKFLYRSSHREVVLIVMLQRVGKGCILRLLWEGDWGA